MKLYTTPPSILTLVTWVPQSRLAFGQTPHVGWLSGLRPSAITILQCAASLAGVHIDGSVAGLVLLAGHYHTAPDSTRALQLASRSHCREDSVDLVQIFGTVTHS